MTKPIQLLVTLPFPGFYESNYSYALDREEEQYCEWRAGEDNGNDEDEARHPPELRLTSNELCDLMTRHTEYRIAEHAVCKMYVDAFEYQASEIFGIKLGLKFESMTSPKFYNFETDRLFAHIPLKTVRALFKFSAAEGHKTLAKVIADRHTSRSGFCSYYPDTLEPWLSKPVSEWDHNELSTLLIATGERIGRTTSDSYTDLSEGFDSDHFRSEVFDSVAEGEGFYSAWESAVSWGDYEAAREEARAEKLADLKESDEMRWSALTGEGEHAPPVRDPNTLDLFQS